MASKFMQFMLGILLIYGLFCAVLYFGQRSMIYVPDKNKPAAVDNI